MKTYKKNKKTRYNYRMSIIEYITIMLFSSIIIRLFYLNIYMQNYYTMKLNKKIENIITQETAPRGRILDRNLNVIVDNISVKTIYYSKEKNTTSAEEISLAYNLSKLLELDYDLLTERNLKEFFIVKEKDYTDSLITDKEKKDLDLRRITLNDIYEYKISRITENDLNRLLNEDRKAAYLYYLMNKGYSYEEKIIKENATDEEYAYISENTNSLKGFNTKLTWKRIYPYGDVLKSILGGLSYNGIPSDNKEYYLKLGYNLNDIVGVSGIEKYYDKILKGTKAEYKINDNNNLELIKEGQKGNDIVLSIDMNLQQQIEEMLKYEIVNAKKEANTNLYNKSFIIIENPKTGEILTIAGQMLLDNDIIDYDYGAIVHSVTPGSVIKGASITVGYNEKVIDIGTIMEDRCIKLYNLPEKCSWKNLGVIDDLTAIKWSSNVYQYKIAMMVGEFNYKYGSELVINPEAFNTYRKVFYQYGLGTKTGIDYPNEETGVKGLQTDGDLLINYAIGQYDTYTPLQITQYISTIANNGNRMKTRLLKSVLKENKIIYENESIKLNSVQTEEKYIKRIQEGMKLVMQSGTGVGFMGNIASKAGKTGTSESFVDINDDGLVDNESITNTFAGYAPFENPIMAITAISPDIQNPKLGSFKSNVNMRIASKATTIFFNIYDENGNVLNK